MDSTVRKAFHILEQLAYHNGHLGVTDLSKTLSLSKSNVHRVLATLIKLGYAENDPTTGRYRPTLKTWEIGIQIRARNILWRAAQSHMRLLHKETGETIYLTALVGDEVLFIDRLEGDYPIRTHPLEGVRTPLYCTATGKVLLAYLDASVVDRVSNNLVPYSDTTITDPLKLREELDVVRSRGFAISRGEWRAGINAVAAPIRNREQQLLGAVSIAGPVERVTESVLEKKALLVMNTATRISESL